MVIVEVARVERESIDFRVGLRGAAFGEREMLIVVGIDVYVAVHPRTCPVERRGQRAACGAGEVRILVFREVDVRLAAGKGNALRRLSAFGQRDAVDVAVGAGGRSVLVEVDGIVLGNLNRVREVERGVVGCAVAYALVFG